ncbi:hypothetical protein F5B18DRAFT_625068 [Nemania serpens]|nr:hypothetical protein F5B18DRAFT_625068 [Nemania serpens]
MAAKPVMCRLLAIELLIVTYLGAPKYLLYRPDNAQLLAPDTTSKCLCSGILVLFLTLLPVVNTLCPRYYFSPFLVIVFTSQRPARRIASAARASLIAELRASYRLVSMIYKHGVMASTIPTSDGQREINDHRAAPGRRACRV